ncbi:MAG: histidine--tRNA ligase [Fusobacteriota bacterium]
MKLKALRGTKDILGEDSLKMEYILDKAKKVFNNYDYKQITTPIFERTDLFQRGIGEGTDVVDKEMYTFTDRGDRSVTLRPEGTASVVRAYMEHKIYGRENLSKFFYYGPMFRYERPQAGRYREFNQIGVEIFGDKTPAMDAEVIMSAYQFLDEINLEDLEIEINSIGCSKCRPNYEQNLKKYIKDRYDNFCSDCQNRHDVNPLRVMDCKNNDCKKELEDAPKITDFLCEDCQDHHNDLKKYLKELEIPYIENKKLVRGLDYYTNTVFEIKTNKLGAQGTVLAGGRYNNLVKEVGDKDIPAIGYAVGIERLMLLLENIEFKTNPDVFMVWFGEEDKTYSLKISKKLRDNNLKVTMLYKEKSFRAQMKKASKMNAKYVIIIGEDERNSGIITMKNFKTGNQEKYKLDEILKKLGKEID